LIILGMVMGAGASFLETGQGGILWWDWRVKSIKRLSLYCQDL
jgi:hypothetical protein